MASRIPRPCDIKAYLDQYVIGQDEAKKTLSVAVYNHYKRIEDRYRTYRRANSGKAPAEPGPYDDIVIDKSNVLLMGPTGSGKTYMVKLLADLLGVPFYIADCTSLTEAGYVGDDVESILTGVLRASDYDVRLAQNAIICLDEIDKLTKREAGPSVTRDVGGEGVQQSLLKILEGATIGCMPQGGRKHPEVPLVYIDTTDILFIGMGAFPGLEDIVNKRLGTRAIGYGDRNASVTDDDAASCVTSADLRRFGLIPEFIGRFGMLTHTDPLDRDALLRILKEPKNSIIMQYRKLLYMDKVELDFTDGALEKIADTALEGGNGARGLRGIMERVLRDVMFDFAGSKKGRKVTIDAAYVSKSL